MRLRNILTWIMLNFFGMAGHLFQNLMAVFDTFDKPFDTDSINHLMHSINHLIHSINHLIRSMNHLSI